MPELPEVETVCNGLRPVMAGKVVARVESFRPDLRFPLPPDLATRLEGQRITGLDRRAKYIRMHLSGGEVMILHLGMSGKCVIAPPGSNQPPGLHDHIIFHMGGDNGQPGCRITYNDPRRFGYIDLVAGGEALEHCRHFAALGPEPLGDDFTPASLSVALKGRRTPIKAALLDQRVVAGLGNIYVCEALWRARISPRRMAATIPGKRAARLVPAIQAVLADAIAAGGSSLRDYRQANGAPGYFQHGFSVYDREGTPCQTPGCGHSISRIVQSGRSTFFCPECQR